MAYVLPILYLIASYTFLLLANLFHNTVELKMIAFLLPFLIGFLNLIVVLTAGRKWSRKTLLNCTLIIKYGLIPLYLIGGCIAVSITVAALFPLPLMIFFGIVAVALLLFGYGILLGSTPYAIAYIVKSCKDGTHSKKAAILSGICQFFFVFDVVSMAVLALKERHLVKTTIVVCCGTFLILLLILLRIITIIF